jgi:hypothetical protein
MATTTATFSTGGDFCDGGGARNADRARSRRTDMQFIELTEDEAKGAKATAGIMVNVDEIAFYQAETRTGSDGPYDCGVLTMRHGGVVRVKEDLATFRDRLAATTSQS